MSRENTRAMMAEIYKRGYSLRNIADKLGISHEMVRSILGDVVRRREKKDIDKDKVRRMHSRLGSYQEVANRIGISRQYVYTIVNDN